jgi:hypothetical protein
MSFINNGIECGYPICCIQQFCTDFGPELMERNTIIIDDKLNMSGFIPCTTHTHQVLTKQITLSSLITNTRNINKHGEFKEIWE